MPAETHLVLKVLSVRDNAVTVRKYYTSPAGIYGDTTETYYAGSRDKKFWVDLQNPTASRDGPNGEIFAVLGSTTQDAAGRSCNGIAMNYHDSANGVSLDIVYDANSGIIRSYAEKYPGQNIFASLI